MEKDNAESLREIFSEMKWKPVELHPKSIDAGLDSLFVSEYAIVGIVFVQSLSKMLSSWAEIQTEMLDLPEIRSNRQKDYYLLFIVDRIDDNLSGGLQSITGDTYECRKICIERRGRSLKETLQDIPFLNTISAFPSKNHPLSDIPNNMPGDLYGIAQTLAKKSAGVILDEMLKGNLPSIERNYEN